MKLHRVRPFLFKHRLLSLFNPRKDKNAPLLSISEVSDLFHFPYSRSTQTENLVKLHYQELPAPLSLKQGNVYDVILGKNSYGGETTLIGINDEERSRHSFVLGGTGSGKSTYILHEIIQDIKYGRGLAVIDPHGELADAIKYTIPDDRWDDFVWVDPDDIDNPVIINLLEIREGLSKTDLLKEKQFVCESVISLFRKIFSDEGAWSAHAYRIEHIFRNAIYTAFTIPNSTIFTVLDLLDDPKFRKEWVLRLKEDRLKKFWMNVYGKAGDFQQVKMIGGITARLSEFFNSPSIKRMMEKPKSSINMDDIMDHKKILICNFSRGKLGENTSVLLGMVMLNKIQLAALRRARVEPEKRTPFYLYMDEFQHYATKSFVNMVSEGRKYGLRITLVQQTTAQQYDHNLTNTIFANVGTVVAFKNAASMDEEVLLPIFYPYIQRGDIMNLPAHHFYIKLSATNPEEPFSGETILPEIKKDEARTEKLIAHSKKLYTVPYVEEDEEAKQEEVTTAGEPTEKAPPKSTPKDQVEVVQDQIDDASVSSKYA